MELFPALSGPGALLAALCVGLVAGLIKGMVGFAMPMVMISGLGLFLAPEIALAGLILPTLVTNGWQALRTGPAAAWAAIREFRLFLAVGAVMLTLSAQLVAVLPQRVLLGLIGGPIVLFAALQLVGWQLRLAQRSARIEAGIGAFAGFIGGMSGVWGPPTVAYLTAIDTPKARQVVIQGVVYGLGAVMLCAAHLRSGVLSGATLPLSALMVLPALAGMALGLAVQDRFDQRTFRRATLAVLLVAGLNLLRRALF
ncbi:MAG: putative permease [Rhodobacteraceae bacterium HLUCCA08]|nr:MAG: putative permease [Rhodobacteraceae bacterium HLUCCA08]